MQIPFFISSAKFLLILIALSFTPEVYSRSSHPRNELPFCPGGGPPGWMNHFDYKRDQNIQRRYPRYQSPYLNPYYYRHEAYHPYPLSPRRSAAYPAVQPFQ